MIFWLAGSIGQLFSGFLQAAAYTHLSGVGGMAGWRWLFIIDGIITLPLAALGFFFFPNLPQGGKKTWWTTEAEHVLSVKRMQAIGRAGKQPWTKAKVKRILFSWHTYLLPMLYVIWNNGGPQPAMGYWLKSFDKKPYPVPGTTFTVPQINNRKFHLLLASKSWLTVVSPFQCLSQQLEYSSLWLSSGVGSLMDHSVGLAIRSFISVVYLP
jgi:MFS family permease